MQYKVLKTQEFKSKEYKIVPLRYEDRMLILKWRNEQIFHLRQSKPLTAADQENYFNDVVSKLSEQELPSQILFSYLENDICIGYGGLVHINWIDKNAEISFIIDTKLESTHFNFHWSTYLSLIEEVAFDELNLHKIFTYAFDVRPHLYKVLEKNKYNKEATLIEHSLFNGKYIDVLIHSKLNSNINIRLANYNDLKLYFEWANDDFVRSQSFYSNKISFEDHTNWFSDKIKSESSFLYVFEVNSTPIGQVRIELDKNHSVIGISIDKKFRGKGLGSEMLKKATKEYFKSQSMPIFAYIKLDNLASSTIFEKSGFIYSSKEKVNDIDCHKFILTK